MCICRNRTKERKRRVLSCNPGHYESPLPSRIRELDSKLSNLTCDPSFQRHNRWCRVRGFSSTCNQLYSFFPPLTVIKFLLGYRIVDTTRFRNVYSSIVEKENSRVAYCTAPPSCSCLFPTRNSR